MNTMELSMDELEMVNGGDSDLGKKITIIATTAGLGAAGGAMAGGLLGSTVPVVGTAIGATVGAAVGTVVGGSIAAINVFFFDD